MTEYNYDLVVIGAGPGGYETAFEALTQIGRASCRERV